MSKELGVLRFRPLSAPDQDRVLAWRNQPDVAAQMFTDRWITAAEHAAWFAAALTDETRRYWIIELDDVPVGLTNLYDISLPHKRASLALYLADERVRGRGVGSATDRFLMRQAFAELGLDKLSAEVLAMNERGIAVHRRNGFAVDGVLRGHVLRAGQRIDVVTMSILRTDWARGMAPVVDG